MLRIDELKENRSETAIPLQATLKRLEGEVGGVGSRESGVESREWGVGSQPTPFSLLPPYLVLLPLNTPITRPYS